MKVRTIIKIVNEVYGGYDNYHLKPVVDYLRVVMFGGSSRGKGRGDEGNSHCVGGVSRSRRL
jgi:hypothetical protein